MSTTDTPKMYPTYRLSVLQSLHMLTALSDDKAMTTELITDHIAEHPAHFSTMTKDQTSAALANCKALGLVQSRPNSNNGAPAHEHLWWLTPQGVKVALTGVMPSSKPKPTPVVDSTPASEIFTPSPLPRKRSTSQPQVTASVVFTFNGAKYTLPLEVIKAIKEFTL